MAHKHQLEPALLKRWIDLLALRSPTDSDDPQEVGRVVPLLALEKLDDLVKESDGRKSINGYRKKGIDLPVVVSNSSDKVELLPGTIAAHSVAVHPTQPSLWLSVGLARSMAR